MNILNFFNKEAESKNDTRRSFFKKSLGAIVGASAIAGAGDLFAMKSKTGLIYVKQNGEVINNYEARGGNQPYLGECMLCGFNFAPNGWVLANGQILSIQQNQALFSLLGTQYGGNGTTTFALPDLRGRFPIGAGQGSGLTGRTQGETGGEENHTLLLSEIPSHTHSVNVSNTTGTTDTPGGNYLAQSSEGINEYASTSNSIMNAGSLNNTGGGQAHNNMQPYLVMSWCIATAGIFPSHS